MANRLEKEIGSTGSSRTTAPDSLSTAAILARVRLAYSERRRRSLVFDPNLFGEPAWDILLDLYLTSHEAGRVSVTSACIGSAVPPTTGLRWLTRLEDQGLVERTPDPQDQRRALVHLSDTAAAMMEEYFRQIMTAEAAAPFDVLKANPGGGIPLTRSA